ncbi:MAG: response regulator [Ilumatobacteraceae bacterium]
MIRILLADDHVLVRAGLSQLLDAQPDIDVVGVACDGQEALEMARKLSPDVVLMDLQMPVVDGITAIGELTATLPEISVIALTTFQEPQQVTAALAAGARGYLVKDVEPAVLVAGIRAVVNGGAPLSPSVAAQLIRSAASQPTTVGSVTQRERQILRLIVAGQSNKQIGRELGISEKTVKSHCGRLFQRINVSDRTQAAVWATKNLPHDDD